MADSIQAIIYLRMSEISILTPTVIRSAIIVKYQTNVYHLLEFHIVLCNVYDTCRMVEKNANSTAMDRIHGL